MKESIDHRYKVYKDTKEKLAMYIANILKLDNSLFQHAGNMFAKVRIG